MTITADKKFFARMHADTTEGRALRRAYRAGATAAADMADQYNGSTIHEYRLGDCILGKMNIRKGKPRKNVHRLLSHKELLDVIVRAHRKALMFFIPRR
jgi:hypothetical protein